jgi:hypothetical protein
MRGESMLSRKNVAAVAVALMILVSVACGTAGAMDLSAGSTPLDQINNLAAEARSAGGSSANVVSPLTPGPAPLTKFSATGRLTESLANGGCSNDPVITSSCSSGCSALTLTGTVNATFGQVYFECMFYPTALDFEWCLPWQRSWNRNLDCGKWQRGEPLFRR